MDRRTVHGDATAGQRGTGTTLRERNPLHALLTMPDVTIRRANLVGFLVTFGFSFFETTISFFTADALHFGPRQLTMIFVVLGLVSIFTQGFLVRRAVPAMGERRATHLGILLIAASMGGLGLSIGVAHSIPLMYVALTFCAVGSGFANVGLSSLISLYAKPEEQGKVTGIYRFARFSRAGVQSCGGGSSLLPLGGTVTFGVAAALLFVPLFLALRLPQPQN